MKKPDDKNRRGGERGEGGPAAKLRGKGEGMPGDKIAGNCGYLYIYIYGGEDGGYFLLRRLMRSISSL